MTKHTIVHVELPVADAKASQAFYSDLFGWEFKPDERFDYTMFQAGEGPGGGFSKLGEHLDPGDVFGYVNTDDIDATVAQAESLGANVVQPKMEIPGAGWVAIFTDPTGNRIGLWQAAGGGG